MKPETLTAHSLARAQSLSPRRNGTRARNSPAQSSTADGRTSKPSVKSGGKGCTSARRTTRSRSGACLLDPSSSFFLLLLVLAVFSLALVLPRFGVARPCGQRKRGVCTITTPQMVFLLCEAGSLACNSCSLQIHLLLARVLFCRKGEREGRSAVSRGSPLAQKSGEG